MELQEINDFRDWKKQKNGIINVKKAFLFMIIHIKENIDFSEYIESSDLCEKIDNIDIENYTLSAFSWPFVVGLRMRGWKRGGKNPNFVNFDFEAAERNLFDAITDPELEWYLPHTLVFSSGEVVEPVDRPS
ncbi:hypothetical protein ACFQ14_14700 [Pseudahrensia aquimaris]|uniref:Uncharacterized protein n=1 Tax=Pseudahrensia aquimaris TaxID=744461 RepID=A0ABW3FHQ7_9HYPH